MFQIKLAFLMGFAYMADSMEMMVLSILGPALSCEWMISNNDKALMTSVIYIWIYFYAQKLLIKQFYIPKIVFVGTMLSSIFWGKLNDTYGRKTVNL
jgi:hypothetical protein